MKIIANWKANMTRSDLKLWTTAAFSNLTDDDLKNVDVLLSASFPYLSDLKELKYEKRFFVCAEDVSKYEEGAHTGEVTAKMIKDFADYVIIGHSERRKEEDSLDEVSLKFKNAVNAGLKPIVCFSNLIEFKAIFDFSSTIKYPHDDIYFAYEPIDSIGNNNPASVDDIKKMIDNCGLNSVIYGGSVNSSSIVNYANTHFICGFLIGRASLDPLEFVKIVKYFS